MLGTDYLILIHFKNNILKSTKPYLFFLLLISAAICGQSTKSLYEIAKVKAKAGKLSQAILDLNSFIKLNPKHSSSRKLRAKIYEQDGEFQKALEDNLAVLDLDANKGDSVRVANLEHVGYDYLRLGEFAKGRVHYQAANALLSDNVTTLFNIGYSYKKDKMYDSSLVYFDRVLALDKSHILALKHKIQAIYSSERHDEALSLSDEFLNSKKFDIDIALTRASILKANGKMELALSDYQRALVNEPEEIDALLGVSECYVALGYYEEDLKLKQRLVKIFKSNEESKSMIASAVYLLGAAYKFLGDYENAIISFNEAESLNPIDVAILLERGLAKASNKDLEGACQDFKKASIMDEKKTSEYEDFVADDAEFVEFAKYCILN